MRLHQGDIRVLAELAFARRRVLSKKPRAFSSEADTASRRENAIKQIDRAACRFHGN
jgi:hypothetical protein